MQLSQILPLGGAIIGIIVIGLGIAALSTPTWIILTSSQQITATYSLFERCNKAINILATPLEGCKDLSNFQTAQGLIIAGVVTVGLGIIASILLCIFIDKRWIKLMPQILLIIGPTLILIGGLLYVKNVLEEFTTGSTKLDLGYSFILILVTCIIGYISAAYFAFASGFASSSNRTLFVVSHRS
jgi:hypothetical protein